MRPAALFRLAKNREDVVDWRVVSGRLTEVCVAVDIPRTEHEPDPMLRAAAGARSQQRVRPRRPRVRTLGSEFRERHSGNRHFHWQLSRLNRRQVDHD